MATSATRLELEDVAPGATDWRAAPQGAERLPAVRIEGRYRFARRAIDPPQLDLTALPGAAGYELLLSPLDEPATIWSLRNTQPRIDLASVWQKLPYGPMQFLPRAWDDQGRLLGAGDFGSIIRSPDWQDRPVQPLNYRAAGERVLDYLANRIPPAREHPADPAYMWHAAVTVAGAPEFHDCQFPALTYPSFIKLFLAGVEQACDAAPRTELLHRARRLCDFLIDHPAATAGPLAGVPYSTMNQQGSGGMFEADRITLVRLAWVGEAALHLAEMTGEQRYAAYAARLATILLDFQQPDGSWPYRVRLSDGAIVESYTAAAIMALLLLEQMEARDPGGPYTAALERGLGWMLENPVRTGLWQQMYEDVRTLDPYANLEQWAALETAMFLLRRRHPHGADLARSLVRYVEDQFVIFGDDPITPVPYLPYTPGNCEQYGCYWPMDFHTANYTRAALALYEATGETAWAQKAVAAANTVVNCQLPDGRLSTLVPDRRLGMAPPFTAWFNCMAHAADVLLRIGPKLEEIGMD
jgi:hypothetical protein